MGRPLYSEQPKTHPPGFFLEVNSSLLTTLWVALALEKHPEIAVDPHDLERTFSLCKEVTWADFWRAFPYKLRESGSYVAEADALGLLLSSAASKQRFQRYFEEFARSGSRRSDVDRGNESQQQPGNTQQSVFRSSGQSSSRQQNSNTLPVRYRRQYQHHYPPQQQSSRQPQAGQISLPAAAAAALARSRHHMVYVPPPASSAQPPASASAAGAAAAGVRSSTAASREQLSGRRRTWSEACEEGTASPAAIAAAPSTAQVSAATAAPQAAAEPSGAFDQQQRQHSEQVVNNSDMWRAVHDWLTSEDAALLSIVSRLVPYSYDGLLRSQDGVKQQLQQLADCRPVASKVVAAISDRLSASANNNLVCLIGNGSGRKAAAAAAALACSDHARYYISLAGIYRSDDIQTAILQGMFTDDHLRSRSPEAPDSPEPAGAAASSSGNTEQAAAAAVELAAAVGAAATTSAAALHDRVRLELRQHVWDAQQTLRAVAAALSDNRREDAMQLMSQVAAPAAAAFGALRPLVSPQLQTRIARLQSILADFGVLASTGDYGRVVEAVRVLSQETEACAAALEADAAATSSAQNATAAAGAATVAGGSAAAAAETAVDPVEQQLQFARTLAAQMDAELPGADPMHAILHQMQLANLQWQQEQQQQLQQEGLPDPSESDSEPEEGLDHLMETVHAGLGGFDFTQRRASTFRVQQPPAFRPVPDFGLPDRRHLRFRYGADYIHDDHEDEDHDDDHSEGSDGESEDDGDQGFGPFRFLNPAGPDANPVAARHNARILSLMAEMGRGGRDSRCVEPFRCGERFSAMLTLLGACSKQPMVLLLDEADSAIIAEDGGVFKKLLMRVMSMLPQAVVVVMSSFKGAAFTESSVLLRQLGKDVRYELSDGSLDIACYRVPKTLYYRCLV